MPNDARWQRTPKLGGDVLQYLVQLLTQLQTQVLAPTQATLGLLGEIAQILSLVLLAQQDPASVALRLAIDLLTQILDQWTQTKATMHAIVLPPATALSTGEAVTGHLVRTTAAGVAAGYGLYQYLRDEPVFVPPTEQVASILGERISRQYAPDQYDPAPPARDKNLAPGQAPRETHAAQPRLARIDTGGIDALVTSLSRSLDDIGDPHRPQYADEAAVAAAMVLVSAPDLLKLTRALAVLYDLWKQAYPHDPTHDLLPSPRSLTANRSAHVGVRSQVSFSLLEIPSAVNTDAYTFGLGFLARQDVPSDDQHLVQVRWDVPLLGAYRTVQFFARGTTVEIERTRLYVSATPFGPTHHGEGLAPHEVGNFDPIVTHVAFALRQDARAYVCATFDLKITEYDVGSAAVTREGQTIVFSPETLKYDRVTRYPRARRSNVVVVPSVKSLDSVGPPVQGTPPDWYSLAGVALDVIPPVREAIVLLRQLLQDMAADLGGLYDEALAIIELIQQALAFVVRRVEAIAQLVAAVKAVVEALADVRVYGAVFLVPPGTRDAPGGTRGFVQAVSDSIYKSKVHTWFGPDDLVAGACFLVAGQAGTQFAPLMGALLGYQTVPEGALSAWDRLVDSNSYTQEAGRIDEIARAVQRHAQLTARDADAAQSVANDLRAQDEAGGLHDLLPNNQC